MEVRGPWEMLLQARYPMAAVATSAVAASAAVLVRMTVLQSP